MQSLRDMYEDRAGKAIPRTATPADTRWHKATIHLTRARDYAAIPWTAYVKESLAVHHDLGTDGKPLATWTITHIESGCSFLVHYKTRAEAYEKADQLLCIEGLWDNPFEAFTNGLRETDAARINAILNTTYRPHRISTEMRQLLAHRAAMRGDNHVR